METAGPSKQPSEAPADSSDEGDSVAVVPPPTLAEAVPKSVAKPKPAAVASTATAIPKATSALTVASGLLRKYAVFFPGTRVYVSLDEQGLGAELARAYANQPAVVGAVLDVTQDDDRDDVAYEMARSLWAKQLLDPNTDRAMLQRLRDEIARSVWIGGEKKQQLDLLDLTLRYKDRGVTPTSPQGTEVVTKEEYATGEKMLKDPKYHKGHAYIPFTGKVTGKKYRPGDEIDNGDKYHPTWCNQFAMDFTKKIAKDDPFDELVQLNTDAAELGNFMAEKPEKFAPLTSFEDAWKDINAGRLVFFSTPDHISIGYPTPEAKMQTRTTADGKAWKFGKVIQAGAKHGILWINQAWDKERFSEIKIYRYTGE
jgi:hypothetical protein